MEEEREESGLADSQSFSFTAFYLTTQLGEQNPVVLTAGLAAESEQEALVKLFGLIGQRSLSEAAASVSDSGGQVELPPGSGYEQGELNLSGLEVISRRVTGQNLDSSEEIPEDHINEFFPA